MNDGTNEPNINLIIGNNIKNIRMKEHISQERLADLIRKKCTLYISFGVARSRGFLLKP